MVKKVLVVNANKYDYTGIVSFIRTYCYSINSSELQIEFVAYEIHEQFHKELDILNLKYYIIPSKKNSPIKYYSALNKILRNNYDVVHVHGSSSLIAMELFLARLHRIPKRIAHCHNTTCTHPRLNQVLRPLFNSSCTDRLACSINAGKWSYGNRKFSVMKNAIDLSRFYYCENKRNNIRKQLCLSNEEIVLGHVGYFNKQKNHQFLINIFAEFHKRHSNSKLILIGGGILENEIMNQVESLKLKDSVIFLGKRNDIEDIMCAMDCFVFPSKWEGLGIVLIEAQATGLPCCVSSVVPNEAQMSSAYCKVDLESTIDSWCEAINKFVTSNYRRNNLCLNNKAEIEKNGYSIQLEKEKLINVYLQI